MTKAIFTVKTGSGYDDRPEEYYHFPRTYLNQVRNAVGDHIIYYEPRRTSGDARTSGRQVYFATARITDIIPDNEKEDHYYALVADYLDFDKPVPFVQDGLYYESALKKDDGTTNKGAFGRAVRAISDSEFDLILRVGFASELIGEGGSEESLVSGFDEPEVEFERPIVEMTVSRPFRDKAFTKAVRVAYENRCAVTGLRLINGGGRPEVQAAHIRPVAANGPDALRNGLALSGTFHWLFDRGLISIADDFRILVAGDVPDQARRMLNSDGKILIPKDIKSRPNPHYLKYHREVVFKG